MATYAIKDTCTIGEKTMDRWKIISILNERISEDKIKWKIYGYLDKGEAYTHLTNKDYSCASCEESVTVDIIEQDKIDPQTYATAIETALGGTKEDIEPSPTP